MVVNLQDICTYVCRLWILSDKSVGLDIVCLISTTHPHAAHRRDLLHKIHDELTFRGRLTAPALSLALVLCHVTIAKDTDLSEATKNLFGDNRPHIHSIRHHAPSSKTSDQHSTIQLQLFHHGKRKRRTRRPVNIPFLTHIPSSYVFPY